jgi:hypothetical protein
MELSAPVELEGMDVSLKFEIDMVIMDYNASRYIQKG